MSASTVEGLPDHGLPEIAFIGRSNVGKSSLLNCLTRSAGLARVSRTPGRTQLLNLFVFEDRWAFVDLPGYGFARLAHDHRDAMQRMVHGYFRERVGLAGVVLLVDARRERPTEDDEGAVAELLRLGRRVLVVATKIDVVAKNVRRQRLSEIERALGLDAGSVLGVSAVTGDGRGQLVAALRELG